MTSDWRQTLYKQLLAYATHSIPVANRWWLALELEDGSKPDGLQVASAQELAALVYILRHAKTAMYDPDTHSLDTNFNPPGEGL